MNSNNPDLSVYEESARIRAEVMRESALTKARVDLRGARESLELAINCTPSGPERNTLTIVNINVAQALSLLKETE